MTFMWPFTLTFIRPYKVIVKVKGHTSCLNFIQTSFNAGMEKNTVSTGVFSLYNGNEIVFSTSTWSWLTSLKLLWRYGFSLIKMEQATKNLLKKFEKIYTLQGNGEAFQSVPDLLNAMSGGSEFYRLTQITAREYLSEQGLSELLIDELVTAITRINYGQSPEVNAFTGRFVWLI